MKKLVVKTCQGCLEAKEVGEKWEGGYWHPDICRRCVNTPPITFEESKQYCDGKWLGAYR